MYLSVHTIGEIRAGIVNISKRGDCYQAGVLDQWLSHILRDYAQRIFPFDLDCAQLWGQLMAKHKQHPVDKQIAAIALVYGMDLVTRNVSDFAGTGVTVINPFVSD